MLPGKSYTPEDYLRIAWTRRWLIIVPAVLIAGAVAAYVQLLPNRYRSSALVLVIGQQVPTDLIRPTVTDSVNERLRAITQQIVSRTKLERIIDEFGLYKKERDYLLMEEIIERMRSRDLDIDIPQGRREDATSFSVSFTAESPRTAMLVAERLASLFVQENTLNREMQAGSTSQFLEAQLEEARRKLKEQDDRIAAFRSQHSGRLPSQVQSNLQMVSTVQAQIEANAAATVRERDRITQIESRIVDLETLARGVAVNVPVTPAGNTPVAQQLQAAREALATMLLSRREEHPDVRQKKREIADLEKQASADPTGPSSPEAPTTTPLREADAERLLALRHEIRELQMSVERRGKEDARLRGQLALYTTRLESTPGVESEFTDLMRDYGTQREQYEELLRKAESSKLAENLERRQIGEQFRVIDTARLPERPISPDRPRLYVMGILAGLAAGFALAGLLEYRDTTLKTDDDVVTSLSLPVLAVIPAMLNGNERARRQRRTKLAIVAASAASLLLVAAAVAWKYRLIQDLVR